MRISHTLGREFLHNKELPMNAVVLRFDNGMALVCSDFNHSRRHKVELLVWLPAQNKWVRTYAKNEHTEMMWDYHRKLQRKSKCKVNCAPLMKHERVHKHGSGGSRIYNGSITDYECTKEPMHDFRRSMCVQWNI